jgi:hypothetical protein
MQNLAAAQRGGSGIGAASTEMAKAQRALRAYQEQMAKDNSGGRFSTVLEAARWVMAHGFLVKERSACDHIKAGVPRQKDGTYLQAQVEEYAVRTWENPSRQMLEGGEEDSGHKARLLRANADLMELKVAEKKGALLDAAEEEARDAAILLGIRRHMEQGLPERIKAMVAELAGAWREGMTAEEFSAAAMVRLPEWIEADMDRLAEAFDKMAQAGGVE